MEHETYVDYAGNPLNSNPYLDNNFLTPNIFNTSDYDFGNMLDFSPLAGESQINMLDTQAYPQFARAKMAGGYVNGSEYFPSFQASTSLIPWITTSTIAPAALSRVPFSNLPMYEIPQSVPLQSQIEPQSDTLAVQLDAGIQQCEAETTYLAGQKRAKPTTCTASEVEEPKPKRRRGARKKVRTEEEMAIRRQHHLQRNRDAAQKCRQKKKITDAEKKDRMDKECQENHIVWNQVASIQDELKSLQILALGIGSHCHSDFHKIAAETSLEMIMTTSTKLQDQIDVCNQRRAQISQGLVMQKWFGGYSQQDSMLDSPGPTQDGQSTEMSPQNSTNFSEQMPSSCFIRESSSGTRRLDTDIANSDEMTRKGSNNSSTQPDSAVDFSSPPGSKKDLLVEDEAIEIQFHVEEGLCQLWASGGSDGDLIFAPLTYM
ncbi:hypothetical protein BKA65DRAFT_592633 [Rhexocercosporidium sp. MPI-PUGE-AT-0058]|nr:hypothetical protein BKA65DRAFT_592633 [Rhexocercosporidium sp. MPI-PUGE-AT-0058]